MLFPKTFVAFYSDLLIPTVGDYRGFPGGSDGESLPAMQETRVQSLGWEDPLEKGMANHSSILAWRIPWTEEPCRPQSKESHTTEQLTL